MSLTFRANQKFKKIICIVTNFHCLTEKHQILLIWWWTITPKVRTCFRVAVHFLSIFYKWSTHINVANNSPWHLGIHQQYMLCSFLDIGVPSRNSWGPGKWYRNYWIRRFLRGMINLSFYNLNIWVTIRSSSKVLF